MTYVMIMACVMPNYIFAYFNVTSFDNTGLIYFHHPFLALTLQKKKNNVSSVETEQRLHVA